MSFYYSIQISKLASDIDWSWFLNCKNKLGHQYPKKYGWEPIVAVRVWLYNSRTMSLAAAFVASWWEHTRGVRLKQFLQHHFHTRDLGKIRCFLGIEVARSKLGINLSQSMYLIFLRRLDCWVFVLLTLPWIQIRNFWEVETYFQIRADTVDWLGSSMISLSRGQISLT
jgi:hypothetical protein